MVYKMRNLKRIWFIPVFHDTVDRNLGLKLVHHQIIIGCESSHSYSIDLYMSVANLGISWMYFHANDEQKNNHTNCDIVCFSFKPWQNRKRWSMQATNHHAIFKVSGKLFQTENCQQIENSHYIDHWTNFGRKVAAHLKIDMFMEVCIWCHSLVCDAGSLLSAFAIYIFHFCMLDKIFCIGQTRKTDIFIRCFVFMHYMLAYHIYKELENWSQSHVEC